MSLSVRSAALAAVLSVVMASTAVAGPLEDGVAAFEAQDYASAQSYLRPLAEQGNATAQLAIGRLYEMGWGVAQDHAKAATWFLLAADQGLAEAQFHLANAYGSGEGVPKDLAECVRWLRLAANQGHSGAEYGLGVYYLTGSGVPEDDAEGVRWLRSAASHGEIGALYSLGLLATDGAKGVQQDLVVAYAMMSLAAAGPNADRVVPDAAAKRDALAARITPAQRADADQRVRAWRPAQ